MAVYIAILFFFGLCLGSFVNALVWRIHEGKGIVKERSQCPACAHQLSAKDLIPVISWITLRGRCRYCQSAISWQYPIVELTGGAVFALSYSFWPGGVHSHGDWLLFITWLLSATGLLALLISDFRWMLLPNKILYPTLWIAAAGRLIYIIGFEPNKTHALLLWGLSILVSSGLFWLLFMVSSGRWIGYGDVRIGLITGTLLADPQKSILMIALASFIGTVFVIPLLALRHKTWGSKIPYGPFLITSASIALLFGTDIINWYKNISLH